MQVFVLRLLGETNLRKNIFCLIFLIARHVFLDAYGEIIL